MEIPQPVWPMPQPKLRHSGLGIGSFIMAAVATAMLLGCITHFLVYTLSNPNWRVDDNEPHELLFGLMMLLAVFIDLVAMVLGVAGLFARGQRRVFAVWGLCISATGIMSFAAMMIVGYMHDH